MGAPFDVHAIEARWRSRWEADAVGRVNFADDGPGTIFYNLAEFPYPSAEGLHIGHVYRYAGVDAYGRYQRMRGLRVFQPIGFDAFGIHTENYALRIGEHPRSLTERTAIRFRDQLSRIGAAWDWNRVIDTSQPEYYRWTQWILCRLFEAGLMYRAEAPVLWCPSCSTVLAREQIEGEGRDATCERCDTTVIERVMEQWFLRITEYADRLVDGLGALDWPERAKRLQRRWIGREGGGYRLHDWLISRQRYWGPPIPIVHCARCGAVPVPDDQLPVLLPDIADVRPTGDTVSPLASAADWVATNCPQCGAGARRETDVSDTFVDSSWYFLRYPSTDFADRAWDQQRTAQALPVDFYAGGAEHVQRHHLYARFVTMALHDLGLVPFEEPFPRLRLGGMIVKDGAKMSKSRGNVVGPDEYIDRHGADVLRCALLFAAPWEQGGAFHEGTITGVERFFARVWRAIVAPDEEGESPIIDEAVATVAGAIERMAFNVAIARLMEVVGDVRSASARRVFVRLLAPFAPHLAEELWYRLGATFSVHDQPWPTQSRASEHTGEPFATVPVQVDGRVRTRIRLSVTADQPDAVEAALTALSEPPATITRVVYIPGRVLNLVTG